jgi:Putative transmembrane protein (PGPGW)
VKRACLRTRTKNLTGGKANGHEQLDHHRPKGPHDKVDPKPSLQNNCITYDQIALEQSELKRIKELPKEVGIMLITAGIVGLILPGPGTPALIAGGLALWPRAFDKVESWLERYHPVAHRESMKQIDRFLNELERRYPYSSRE